MIRTSHCPSPWPLLLLGFACATGPSQFPGSATPPALPASHAEVKTLNPEYQRLHSRVLVREVSRPTRALLDYAAYHQNFMIAEPPPEGDEDAPGAADTTHPFGGLLEKNTLTGNLADLGLTASERVSPLAFAPLVEFLAANKLEGTPLLAELSAKVRDESFGLRRRPGIATQSVTEAFLHALPGKPAELYVKVEFTPWFKALGALPDQDGDGYPEIYGRVRADHVPAGAAAFIQKEYVGKELTPAETKLWANQLSSYWYPSFNTDLLAPGAAWPDAQTEPAILKELGGQRFASPSIVMRGKPQGEPTYNVFLVRGLAGSAPTAASAGALVLAKTTPTPDPKPLDAAISAELSANGGSFEQWVKNVAPARDSFKSRLKSIPAGSKALAGANGFLFFQRSLEFAVAGDLEAQKPGKNPLPVIVEFQQKLRAHGVDFLFVPVPTKEEIYPDELDPKLAPFAGRVVQPYLRKLEQSLARSGVEVLDLLTPFLAARSARATPGEEPLYQRQDTHWTDRGLRLAAERIAARVKRYPWYGELSKHARAFTLRDASFQRFGDLQSRLPERQKATYQPESLLAHQVVAADGSLYEDDPASPVVILGDSYSGVYELMDAEHAGVSAHLARDIAYPVDLVMSYGGGPNVRSKLLRRGTEALDAKKLVVWLMTARDLHAYWENWEPLGAP